MIVSMYVQQAMTPSTMDPAQKKIFMFMPVFWGFFLKDMPSGLVLYWLFSNLLTIVQQLVDEPNREGGRPHAAGPGREGAQAGAGVRAETKPMRYEAKTEQDAVEAPRRRSEGPPRSSRYTVIRDEKAFWGGRVVEIEVEDGGSRSPEAESRKPEPQRAQPAEPFERPEAEPLRRGAFAPRPRRPRPMPWRRSRRR